MVGEGEGALGDGRFREGADQIPNHMFRTPNSGPLTRKPKTGAHKPGFRIQNLKLGTRDSKPENRTPDPESQTPNPEIRTRHPEPDTRNPDRIPSTETWNLDPETRNHKPKFGRVFVIEVGLNESYYTPGSY